MEASFTARRAPLPLAWLALSLAWHPSAHSRSGPAPVAEMAPITVTAGKRDQTLESFNGAVHVATDEDLQAAQVENTLQLSRVLPGVQTSESGSLFFPIVSVRGVTSAQDFYNPALTVYVDGVPQLPTFMSQQLLDVERVELLKGPQGTLYGRSAQGGVLDIVTRQPGSQPHLRASAGVSSRDGYAFKASAGGPLVDGLLYGGISGAASDAPGRLENPVTGKQGLGGQNGTAGSARLRLAPDGRPWELAASASGECTRALQDAYVPYGDLESRQAYIMPGIPADRSDFDLRRCASSQSLTGRYDFAAGWRLSAMAAWQRLHFDREYPIGPYYTMQPERWRQQVQELRLATTGERAVDAVIGLYRQRVTQDRSYRNDLYVPLQARALETGSHNETESLAAFADLTWHATRRLDLGAGLRVSRDEASTDYAGQALNFMTFGYDGFGGRGTARQTTVLGKASAGYRFSHAWRGYASVSQGYKPAGYNLAPSSDADAQAFGRERSVSYEVGARYAGRSLRAGAAVYRIDTRDAQLYVSDAIGYQHLENVGRLRSTGVELDLRWDVAERWTLGLDAYYNRAEFRSIDNPYGCPGCSGNKVPFSPSYGVTASVQARLDTALGEVSPMLAVRRTGGQYFDIANDLRQDAYTLIDLSVAWRPRDEITVTAYAHNLTDRLYRTYGFGSAALGDYAQVNAGRTVGLNIAYAY